MGDMFFQSSAILSDCGLYRYRLDRRWSDGPACGFIMLNPSTADADQDDPTIRRCIGFAKREGCGALIVVNLYSLRATRPADLWATIHPKRFGPYSAMHYETAMRQVTGPLIAAWGSGFPKGCEEPDLAVRHHGNRLMCLGKTKDGHPRHPLYVKGDAPLIALHEGGQIAAAPEGRDLNDVLMGVS